MANVPALAFGRIRIMAVTVLVLDLPVLAMNDQLALLVLSDFPGSINRVLFAIEHLGVALSPGTPDRPALVSRDDMLIALGHDGHFVARRSCR